MSANQDVPVHESFARALAALWTRDGLRVDAPDALALTIASSFSAGDDGIKAASALLRNSGVREQWNDVLCRSRANALAARIYPHVTGPLVDVLSGDGSVCRALSDLGLGALSATERSGDYPSSHLPSHILFETFADDLDFTRFGASTALLSTVLHHEPDPCRLLDSLARAGISRWIVVENCVTPEFSRPFHRFADEFFNRCLNEFGLKCVEQHRTLHEWEKLLSAYGTLCVIDESFDVPGIPFPYSLLIVNCSASASITRPSRDDRPLS